MFLPKNGLHLQVDGKVLMNYLQCFPDLAVHAAEEFSAQLVK